MNKVGAAEANRAARFARNCAAVGWPIPVRDQRHREGQRKVHRHAQSPQGKGARTDIGDARDTGGQVGLRPGHLVCPLANNAPSTVSVARRTRTVFELRAAIGFAGL